MCGRFQIPAPDDSAEELNAVLEEMRRRQQRRQPDFQPKRGELRPGDTAAVIAPDRSRRRAVFAMRWGFLLPRPEPPRQGVQLRMEELLPEPPQEVAGRRVFNARSESAARKPLFAESLRERRCVIPAQAYFEWDHRRQPMEKYRFYLPQDRVLWMLGLYRLREGQAEFTILTREAAEGVADFHDRMPLIAPGELVEAWLQPDVPPGEIYARALTDLRWERA